MNYMFSYSVHCQANRYKQISVNFKFFQKHNEIGRLRLTSFLGLAHIKCMFYLFVVAMVERHNMSFAYMVS